MWEVYKITNSVNGKIYIGVTGLGYMKRFRGHQRAAVLGNEKVLYSAMRKYGLENFSIEKIGEADSKRAGHDLEIRLIAENKSWPPNGYNVSVGGDGLGTENITYLEQKRVEVLARYENAEYYQKITAKMNDGRRTEEHYLLRCELQKLNQKDPEIRAKWVETNRQFDAIVFTNPILTSTEKRTSANSIPGRIRGRLSSGMSYEEAVEELLRYDWPISDKYRASKRAWLSGYLRGMIRQGFLDYTVREVLITVGSNQLPETKSLGKIQKLLTEDPWPFEGLLAFMAENVSELSREKSRQASNEAWAWRTLMHGIARGHLEKLYV